MSRPKIGPGTVLAERYRLEREIGRGGMSVVYRAVSSTRLASGRAVERPVAIKILHRDVTWSTQDEMRFAREARVASAFSHPAAVPVYDYGEEEGIAFLVMELLEGETLRARLARQPSGVGVERSLAWLSSLVEAVGAFHAAGLTHRDLKPDNVFFENEERVRILDFGLAFAERHEGAGRMTAEGVVVGTAEYLSPEQARGLAVGPPTDVYALGCILHEMLTGRPPFVGTSAEVVTKQMFAPPPTLAREGEPLIVPTALDELRLAMLDKRASARPTADVAMGALRLIDPDPDKARARAGAAGYLGPRAERMVDAGETKLTASSPSAEFEVAVVGSIGSELALGLAANRIVAFTLSADEPIDEDTSALFAPFADADAVRALVAHGLPIVATAARGDLARLSELMRAGAADVVLTPVHAADLAKKLRRVARRRARDR
ncbi:MAG: serine/threonine-protein kinase [Sandaracinaceae bacterium]